MITTINTHTLENFKTTPKQLREYRRNHNGNKKYLELQNNECDMYQICENQVKAFFRGKIQPCIFSKHRKADNIPSIQSSIQNNINHENSRRKEIRDKSRYQSNEEKSNK